MVSNIFHSILIQKQLSLNKIKMKAMPRIKLIVFGLICGVLQANAIQQKKLKVAVIGAGAAGLASAKHALDYGYNVTVFEKSEALGGVWYFTNKTGKDAFGVPVHSPQYEGLRCV